MPQVESDAWHPPCKCDSDIYPTIRNVVAILIAIACGLVTSCRDEATTWSSEVRSPDGTWLATARSTQGGSFGGAYDVTTVNLKWIGGSQPPVQILLFSHEFATMKLKMEWVTPKHLDVSYGGGRPGDQVNLEFQAIKCAGVDISVRNLSPISASP